VVTSYALHIYAFVTHQTCSVRESDSRMKNKLVSLETAAAGAKNGDLIGLTTSTVDNTPMAFLREVIRQRIRQLRLVTLTGGGLNADLLIGAGAIAEYETCSCSLSGYGAAPNFQRALRAGLIKMKDST
jgi:glutaconate CoA-transferase, subunit A